MNRSILFVCLGNICRSPMAEGAMRHVAEREGIDIEIDSGGTGDWHVGNPPDRRAQDTARANGIDISRQCARQVLPGDFEAFDHIVAMDRSVLEDLQAIRPSDAHAELSLFMDHVRGKEGQDVTDPYYGERDGFSDVWRDVMAGVEGLLAKLR